MLTPLLSLTLIPDEMTQSPRLLIVQEEGTAIWVSEPFASIPSLPGFPEWKRISLPSNTAPELSNRQNGSEHEGGCALGLLRQHERDLIIRTLWEAGGNKLQTAERLGIGRQTLYNKLETYGMADRIRRKVARAPG